MKKRNNLLRTLCSAVLFAGSMYAFNKLYSYFAVRKRRLSARSENFFNWRGLRIYYRCKGSGSPIILLHAIHPASSAFEWSEVEDLLAQKHRVFVLDLPGCGRSSKPNTLYTSFYYTSLLKDFIETMAIKKPVVAASNLTSASVVISEAYQAGLISKIILISPPSAAKLAEVPDKFSKIRMAILKNPLLGLFIYNILSNKSQIDYYFTEKYFYNPFHDNKDLVDTYFESAQLGYGNGHYLYASIEGKYLNFNIDHAVKNLDIPLKIIEGGSLDNAGQVIEEWKALNPAIQTVTIPHTKQLPHLEEPEKVSREILNFTDN